jgi:GNAT superfamily N-acetyltransferase
MKEIYFAAYSHFWTDEGDWYVKEQYAKVNLEKELAEENAPYYFILFKNEIVGIFRFVWEEKLDDILGEKQLKLHRIYLHPMAQGKGIGKKLLLWLEQKALKKGYLIVWLDAMDKQIDSFEFYRKLGYSYHNHVFLPFDLMHKEFRRMSQIYKRLSPS